MTKNQANNRDKVLVAPPRSGMSVLASYLALEQIVAGATECIFDIGKSSDGLINTPQES